MSRDFFINGETLVLVKGRSDSAIGTLTELGLSSDPIRVSPVFKHKDILVDAWGEVPADVQFMLAEATVTMNLIHIDRGVLNTVIQESMAGAPAIGSLARAGQRMGNNQPRFGPGGANGNHYIGLNLSSPVGNLPWCFYYAYLSSPPVQIPLGTEKSVFACQWRVVPYVQDPYGNGQGAYGAVLWSHVLDT